MSILDLIYKFENINKEEVNLINGNISRILSHKLIGNVGLLYGKVQSGKTRNLICLTGKLLDEDYKLVIVLTSNTLSLLDQNLDRFDKVFGREELKKDIKIIKSADIKSDYYNNKKFDYYFKNEKKIIIFCLKHQKHIEDVFKKLKDTEYLKCKSLILDDEGDDITQNSAINKLDPTTGEEINRTSVNKNLVDLKNTFNCSLISITATPQSNLLLQPQQELAPTWCETLNVSNEYCGLEDYLNDEESFEIIEDDWKKLHDEDGVIESLKNALSFFIVSSTILRFHNKENGKTQMLVHTDKLTVSHETLETKIKLTLEHYFKSKTFKDEIFLKFNEYYENIRKRNNDLKLKEFSSYNFIETIDLIEVIKVNSKDNIFLTKKMEEIIEDSPPHIIFIGGELLDRGITIPQLVTTYISRESKQVDTLLQRARWLGYRKEIFYLSKIFFTEKLFEAYQKIVLANNFMLKMLEYCAEKNINLKDFDFKLRLEGNLNITNKNKAQWETYDPEWFLQETPNINIQNNKLNLDKVEHFIDLLEGSVMEYMNLKGRSTFLNLCKFLNEFYTYEKDFKFKNLIQFLEDLKLDDDEEVEVLVMRNRNPEERSLKNNFHVNNLFQGPNKSNHNLYPGDRNLLGKKIQLQIHFVKLKNDMLNENKSQVIYFKDTIIPMLALGIPIFYRENKFIKRKNIFERT